MTELAFFIGKGGVGKTTLSSAFAIREARRRRAGKVLLISTDPAHSLADVLLTPLTDSPRTVNLGKGKDLFACELNAAKRFSRFLNSHKEEILSAVERGSIFTRQEVSALLESSLPGMSEIAALLTIQELLEANDYSSVIVDTAPLGHALRLFGLPEQFLRLLNFLELAADRDRVLAQHFGGSASQREIVFVDVWRSRIAELQRALGEAEIFLVTTAEKFSLHEALRCVPELKALGTGLKLQAMVLNRVVTRPGRCVFCKNRAEQARAARKFVRKKFPDARLYIAEDPGVPVLGVDRVGQLAERVFANRPVRWKAPEISRKTVQVRLRPVRWPLSGERLAFVVGKGGVGKTTVSAGVGYWTRKQAQDEVEICSVDPAPSLDDIFQTTVDDHPRPVLHDRGFLASELDAVAVFKRWIAEIRAEVESATSVDHSGVHIDLSYERRLFSELLEIVPPGVDELLAMFRVIDLIENSNRKVIIDMAPTGHALELLRMPERVLEWSRLLLKTLAMHRKLALAREAAVKIAAIEVQARELSQALRNSGQTAIYAVALPEYLPDRETQLLLKALAELRTPVGALFVNRVLLRDRVGNCRRCRATAASQAELLGQLKKRFPGTSIYVIPDFGHEIAGIAGLRELTRELWLLN